MKILDGKKIFNDIKAELKEEVSNLKKNNLKLPHLAAVLIGDSPASMTYVNAKVRACKEIGFSSTVINLPPEISQNDLLNKIDELNNSKKIDGIIVQLPIPKHIDENTVIHRISHKKDVDGFHPINLGRMVLGLPCFLPQLPLVLLL